MQPNAVVMYSNKRKLGHHSSFRINAMASRLRRTVIVLKRYASSHGARTSNRPRRPKVSRKSPQSTESIESISSSEPPESIESGDPPSEPPKATKSKQATLSLSKKRGRKARTESNTLVTAALAGDMHSVEDDQREADVTRIKVDEEADSPPSKQMKTTSENCTVCGKDGHSSAYFMPLICLL